MRSNIATVPLGRLGYPRDIGSVVAVLASDDAERITGAESIVDGRRFADEFVTHHGVPPKK